MKAINIKNIVILILIAANFKAYSQHDLHGIWSKRAAFGSGGSSVISTSTIDEDGNVYVAGGFTGSLNFCDDICNPVIRTAPYPVSSSFIIKYDKNGQYLWDVVFSPAAATVNSHNIASIYYKEGKILYAGVSSSPIEAGLPLSVNVVGTGVGNTKTITSPSIADGSASGAYHQIYFQVIEASTGRLQASISELPTGAVNLASARIEGNNVIAVHFGWASVHGDNSIVASFQLTGNGDSYTVNNIALSYPNQPKSPHPANNDGSRIRQNVTLPNGEQVFVHYAHDYTDNVGGSGVPSYYVMNYTNDYLTHNSTVLITDRAADANLPPMVAYDAGSNVYLMTNFGDSKYWNWPRNDISNSNFILDYMGSGQDFYTEPQYNKIALARVNHDLTFSNGAWAIQIGSPGTGGTDMVYGSVIKVDGNYIYVTGQFKGVNVPFGNGKTLSSEGNEFDGFYAVYNADSGVCEYAVKIGGTGVENNTTINVVPSSNEVLIGGTYTSPVFQPDPAERLYPLSNSGNAQQGFLTLYSTDQSSQPTPYPSSYGDAPLSYGSAVHHASACIRIGGMDFGRLQTFPQYSLDANTSLNDDGVNIALSGGYADLSSTDFNLDASGNLTAKVSVLNSTGDHAKLLGWIDFNRNGVFDGADEASAPVTVNANTTTPITVDLQWANANTKLQNGVTYMRLRITTDNMDNSQPQGLFFNGETEDYKLNFDILKISKTAVSNNKYNTAHAMIGDTITYTVSVTNKVAGNVAVFDPIPLGTEYVAGSAVPSTGTLTTVNLYGSQNIPAIKWNLGNKAANDISILTFRARLISYPAGVDSVFNIAYAVMNGDTIPSTGNACDMAIITVDGPRANNDTASTLRNTPVTIDVLANDDYPSFCVPELTLIEDSYNNLGVATVSSGKILYTPNTNLSGIDSILYQLKCADGRTSTAKVYVIISDPLSLKYVACPDALVKMGFNEISGVTYHWYNASTGGAIVNDGDQVDTLIVTKDNINNDIGTWWVEPRYNNIVFPRHRVDLGLSDNCRTTDPQGCAATGTVIWRDDFGGNDTESPRRAPDPGWTATGKTTYNYVTRTNYLLPTSNEYALLKNTHGVVHAWSHGDLDDHTSWGDTTRGYFLTFDATADPGEFYNFEIDNLCAGSTLTFSAWLMNLTSIIRPSTYVSPNMAFLIEDMSGNVLSTFYTGDVPRTYNEGPVWFNYAFNFTVPSGIDKLHVTVMNNQPGTNGNDVSIDDIEVRLCAPAVTTNIAGNDTIVCDGNNLNIIGTYEIDCTFGNELAYRWEFRHVDSSSWKPIPTGTGTTTIVDCSISQTITKTVSLTSATKANEGYYRMLVSSPASIERVNCRAASDSVYVYIIEKFVAPDIRIQVCPSPPNHTIQLTKYLDSTDYNRVKWEHPLITNVETGLIYDKVLYKNNTYTLKYTLMSPEHSGCGSTSAKVYIRTLNDRIFGKTVDTITICSALATSRFVNLNQIFGLELGGVWTYPNPDNVVHDNIKEHTSPSKYEGAIVFNAQKAYNEAGSVYDYGSATVKKFDFVYTMPSSSCVNGTKRVTLIVTQ